MNAIASKIENSLPFQLVGYILSYVFFVFLIKASEAASSSYGHAGVLPLASIGNFLAIGTFLVLSGWWWHAAKARGSGHSHPCPRWFTVISGLCILVVVLTTTLSYTFGNLLAATLLLRGGAIVAAILVDWLIKRKSPSPQSWVGIGLSFLAVAVTYVPREGRTEVWGLLAVILANSIAYGVRLTSMTLWGRGCDTKRYFVEEQLVITPAYLIGVLCIAIVVGIGHPGDSNDAIQHLANGLPANLMSSWSWSLPLGVGVFSAFTGIFGTMILLQPRSNVFGVTLSRAGAIVGTYFAVLIGALIGLAGVMHSVYDLAGAVLGVVAICVLYWKPRTSRASPRASAASEKQP